MTRKIPRIILLVAAVTFCLAQFGRAQEKEKGPKRAPIQNISPASGEEMFKSYCAACHGKDAKGGGPASSELKTMPPDLTTLAKRHDGKFPADYVANVLRSGAKTPVHGTSDMPVWGPLFSSVSSGDQAIVTMRIANLVHYLESLQVK